MQDAEDETKDYSVKETKGEQGGVDEVGGEQRRSVSFIAHSRPLREGLTSQGLRGKLVVLAVCFLLSGLPGEPRYLALQVKATTHRRPPWPATTTQQRTFFVLCQVPVYLTRTASRGVTWANGSLPVPAHSCATDGCGVSTRAFCTALSSSSQGM